MICENTLSSGFYFHLGSVFAELALVAATIAVATIIMLFFAWWIR